MKFLDRNKPDVAMERVAEIGREMFGLDGELRLLASERDLNFRVKTAVSDTYVLKIANVDEDEGVLSFQTEALRYIEQQDPDLTVPRVRLTSKGKPLDTVTTENGNKHLVRVLSYLPGKLVQDAPQNKSLWRNIGRFMARADLALRGFFHPNAHHELLWGMTQCEALRPHTKHIADDAARANIEVILDNMITSVLPRVRHLRHQVIHNDGHGANLLVDETEQTAVAGLLDFGDMIYAPLVQEIAIACDIGGLSLENALEKMAAITFGFDEVLPLEGDEIDFIYDLVLARLAVNAVIVAWRNSADPEEEDYSSTLWHSIAELKGMGKAAVSDYLRRACRFPTYTPNYADDEPLPEATDVLLARRKQVLGQHLQHFYTTPVHLEKGCGVWLIGANGERFLDAYNNVAVVGHAHPHVAKAIGRQTAVLNTNTRYIYRNILDYAEQLLATLPDHINVCAFVNSGSEANDIAWRIAKHITGNSGAMITDNAYHGITEAIKPLSPDDGAPIQPHVFPIMPPNPYRGVYQYGEADLAGKYAADADRAIADMAKVGMKPAAFMVDSALVSNGSPDIPAGWETAVVEKVRAAGGLFIADEVQSGFGRMGGHMWGHVFHGAQADIVTMGKPVASGFPMGVICTTADILNQFVGEVGLFSTFGGNPVACAGGTAVLDVIEDEDLVNNAQTTGTYLREGIKGLMDKHDMIGDVRGFGLIAGVDLVRDRETKEPAKEETLRILDLMRNNGVLIGKGSANGNVLKIRPPMIFKPEHADILVEALDKSLATL